MSAKSTGEIAYPRDVLGLTHTSTHLGLGRVFRDWDTRRRLDHGLRGERYHGRFAPRNRTRLTGIN